eukprot:1313443-Amphidinium_carterae.1
MSITGRPSCRIMPRMRAHSVEQGTQAGKDGKQLATHTAATAKGKLDDPAEKRTSGDGTSTALTGVRSLRPITPYLTAEKGRVARLKVPLALRNANFVSQVPRSHDIKVMNNGPDSAKEIKLGQFSSSGGAIANHCDPRGKQFW